MSNLSIVRERVQQGELVTIATILELLRPEEFDRIEAKIRMMRETFPCPHTVKDYEEFKYLIMLFWAHYHKAMYNMTYGGDARDLPGLIKEQAFRFVEQHLGGVQGWSAAERNAIKGREGGMVSVLDSLTDAIVKSHTQSYIQAVFFDVLRPSDYDARLRLAQELLNKYAPVLFPGEELKPYWLLGANIEQFIQGFVTQLQGLRKQWQR